MYKVKYFKFYDDGNGNLIKPKSKTSMQIFDKAEYFKNGSVTATKSYYENNHNVEETILFTKSTKPIIYKADERYIAYGIYQWNRIIN